MIALLTVSIVLIGYSALSGQLDRRGVTWRQVLTFATALAA